MREINCRAFVGNDIIEGRKAQIYTVLAYHWKPSGNEVELWDDLKPITTIAVKWCEVIWATGLKDKNGKEIYEGDILQWCNTSIVKTKWTVEATDGGWYPFIELMVTDRPDRFEVIGNIYENPELLKEG